jgi:hypothetical protein
VNARAARSTSLPYILGAVSDSDWRMIVTFVEVGDAESLVRQVEGRSAIAAAGGSISFSDGDKRVFFYAPSSESIRVVADVVRSDAHRWG